MNIKKRTHNHTNIYDFEGRIDFHPYDLLDKSIFRDALESETRAVLLNFKNLKYISSLGIKFIYDIKVQLQAKGIAFSIVEASEPVIQVLKLLGLYESFSTYKTEATAIEQIEK